MQILFDYYKNDMAHLKIQGFIDGTSFKKYRNICEENGCPYLSGSKTHSCHLFIVKHVAKQLEKGGFYPIFSQDLKKEYKRYNEYIKSKTNSFQRYIEKFNDRIGEFGYSLFDHQKSGAEFLALRNGAILADEMGLGKTLLTILATPPKAPVIVISPVNAKGVWKKEFGRATNRKITTLNGRTSFRWPENEEVIITNYDILPECLAYSLPTEMNHLLVPKGRTPAEKECEKEEKKRRKKLAEPFKQKMKSLEDNLLSSCPEYCILIADEGHRLKNPKALRTKRYSKISKKIIEKNGRSWILTGTPMKKDGRDVGSLLNCIGKLEETFGSYASYKKQMGVEDRGQVALPKPSAKFYLANVMLRRLKEDVLDLPPRIVELIPVEVDDKYIHECDEFMALCRKKNITFEEAFEMAKDPNSPLYHHIMKIKSALALSKTPAVLDMIEDYENAEEPILVGCTHVKPLEIIAERKGWGIIRGGVDGQKRDKIVEDFQAGKYKGLALSTLAAGEGLTLHHSCVMINIDRYWGPTENDQLRERISRPGQTRTCYFKELVIEHPIEQLIFDICSNKRKTISASIDALAELQKGK